MRDKSRMKKNKRKTDTKKRAAGILLAAAIVIIAYIGMNVYEICDYSTIDEKCRADAAIILGAAVYGDEPSPVYRERLNHGITIYEEGYVDRLIVTGGCADGGTKSEAAVAKEYLMKEGIPEEAVLTEEKSAITQENLEYSKAIMEQMHMETAVVVSDPLHMKRAMLLAEDAGIRAYSSPTPTTMYQSLKTKIPFLARETFYYIGYKWYRIFVS